MNPRPERKSKEIVKQAAEKLADDMVKNWGLPVEDRDLAVDDLSEALRYNEDGYDLARELDGKYDPDAALVDILDSASHLLSSAHTAACEKWVAESGLKGPEAGARVLSTKRQYLDAGEGIVVRSNTDGKSTVSFPKLGHVGHLENEPMKVIGLGRRTLGAIIEWEFLAVQDGPGMQPQ